MRSSSAQDYASRALPLLTTVAIVATGVWILYPQPRFDHPLARGLATLLLTRAALVCPTVVGVAAGVSVWLLQKSAVRQRELQAANRALEELNKQLKQEALNAIHSEQRFRLLFASNPCPMLIGNCHTTAITDANDAALRLYGYTREEFLRLT